MFMNMPGLKIAIPTTPADAKGLLKTAIRDNDPVMFFEDNNLAGTRGEVDEDDGNTIPFGVADVKQEGSDVTVVALAGMVRRAMAVAESLDEEDISVEVIDPRTIVPLDTRTILDSVEKTGAAGDSGPGAQELQRGVRDFGDGGAGRVLEPAKPDSAGYELGLPFSVQPGAGVRGLS